MAEQRKAKRIKLTSLASFFGDRLVTVGILQDLSASGAKVMTEESLRPGDTVELKLELPSGGGALRVLARVVWQRGSGNPYHPHLLGLEFVLSGKEELARLKAFAAGSEEDSQSDRPPGEG